MYCVFQIAAFVNTKYVLFPKYQSFPAGAATPGLCRLYPPQHTHQELGRRAVKGSL
jgi:hypothetical protein